MSALSTEIVPRESQRVEASDKLPRKIVDSIVGGVKTLRRLAKTAGLVGEVLGDTTLERFGYQGKYQAAHVIDKDEIQKNRLLVTHTFQKLGHLRDEDVDKMTGLPNNDPYHDRGLSRYFNAYNSSGDCVAATKLLWSETINIEQLRTPLEQMDSRVATFLESLEPGRVAEIGGLAKVPGTSNLATLAVFREVFVFAEKHGIEYLVGGLEPAAWKKYKLIFGDSIRMVHSPDEKVYPPGAHGGKVGVILDAARAAKIYRRDMIDGSPSEDWLEIAVGANIDGSERHSKGIATKLGKKAVGTAIMHYFSNRVLSFRSRISPWS